MAVLSIVQEPHKVLRKIAGEVPAPEIASARIQRLVSDMKDTLRVAPDGVGLAAPQVGESLKIFLVSEEAKHVASHQQSAISNQQHERKWEYYVFINPTLLRSSRKKIVMLEGCLSVPGKFGEVRRSEKVELSWLDEHGKKHSRGFTGFFARVIQHEMDHLAGILISDRAKRLSDVSTIASRASSKVR